MGIPINMDKLEGPAQIMKILGTVFDTLRMTMYSDRLSDLLRELASTPCSFKAPAPVPDGAAAVAAKVIRPGRAFTRRIIATFANHYALKKNRSASARAFREQPNQQIVG